MARMKPAARAALKRKAFKKPIAEYLAGSIEWNDDSLKPVKDLVRELLRLEQAETCPYCQRLIIPERRNLTEHIEHYLDKSRSYYRKFGFTATNVVLSCPGCNVEKGTRDLLTSGKAKPDYISAAIAPFRWPHPYFDDMKACVHKAPGPVYSVVRGTNRESEAHQMIIDLKLDKIEHAESRHGLLISEQNRLLVRMNSLINSGDLASVATRVEMKSIVERLKRISTELN